MATIRAAVLTVSDTAFADRTADKSGPAIKEILTSNGITCNYTSIVPDLIPAIQNVVGQWCSQDDVDWIITTGGTGFGVRDLTPEAIRELLEREASGLVHLLLSSSLKHTPLAALSRPVAGVIGKTLLVTLPGSVKAVKENMEALLNAGVVNHAVDLVKGGTGQQVHAEMAKAGTTSQGPQEERHHYHHHHNHHEHRAPQPRTYISQDLAAPVSARQRDSPYPLISLEDALDIIEKNTTRLEATTLLVDPDLRGHVLAVDVYAPQNVPPSSTTSVDGYALRASDVPAVYKVLTSQTHSLTNMLPPGSIYRINTGNPLPAGTDAVLMVEDTRLVSTIKGSDSILEGEENEVETLAQIPAGENVRTPGSDVRRGDLVLQKGERIGSTGGEIGTLTFVGRKEVEVYRKPVVAILSTGNEIVDLQSLYLNPIDDSWGGIFDTNRPSLHALLEGMGYKVVDLGIVPDDVNSHVSAIQRGLESADILLTTGGTSMGPTDLLKPVIERHFNGTIHFGRVTVKPGKPTTFATIPFRDGTLKPVFALPGNPASALVTFNIFVVPALRLLGGWPKELCRLPRVQVELRNPMNLDPRTEFHRVIIRASPDGLKAFSTGGQRSSRVASLSGANGLVILPPKTLDSPARLEVGTKVDAVVIGELQML